jgi:hypothetical protein
VVALDWGVLLTVAALTVAIASAVRSDHFAWKASSLEADPWGVAGVHDHQWCIVVFSEFNRCLVLRRGYLMAGTFFLLSTVLFGLMSFAGRSGLRLLEIGVVLACLGLARLIVLRVAVMKSRAQEKGARAAAATRRPLAVQGRKIA